MIERYDVKEMSTIWSEESRFNYYLKVELCLLKELEQMGIIPNGTTSAFKDVKIKIPRIKEIESTTRHEIIAFCSSITEQVSSEHGRFFHFGVTSSDILDTALSLQLKESLKLIIHEIEQLMSVLMDKAKETKDLLCIGRSHGMYAEPMIFAQKFLSLHQELYRRKQDYIKILEQGLTGQLSGAVGNYTVISPDLEANCIKNLGLRVETVSTQVIPRDHIMQIISSGALTACALERLMLEIRLLHHSDVSEVFEGFKLGQKGSSTMPHKKNPISSENITGLARLIKSHVDIAMGNNNLWHERDISHSSNERMYLPDHFGILHYILGRAKNTIKDLVIERDKIERKAFENTSCFSSYLLHEMIKINHQPREEIYHFIQKISFDLRPGENLLHKAQSQAAEQGFRLPDLNQFDLKQHYLSQFERVWQRISL